jgi:hypothetical protein
MSIVPLTSIGEETAGRRIGSHAICQVKQFARSTLICQSVRTSVTLNRTGGAGIRRDSDVRHKLR